MRESLTPEHVIPEHVTPEQRQVIHKAVTLIDYPSFFAKYSEQLDKLKGASRLQVTAIKSVDSVELYYMELRVGTASFGGFVFAAVPLDTVFWWAACGQHPPETRLAQWTQLATAHHTYALRRLHFLPKPFPFNAAIRKLIVRNFQQKLRQQESLLAERFRQLLERQFAEVDDQ